MSNTREMKSKWKKFIVSFFIYGFSFAILMAIINKAEGEQFNLRKFLFRALLYGIGMALLFSFVLPATFNKKPEPK